MMSQLLSNSNRFMNSLIIKCKSKTVIIVTLQSANHSASMCFSLFIFKFFLYVSVCFHTCDNKCWFNSDKATSNTRLSASAIQVDLLVPSPFLPFPTHSVLPHFVSVTSYCSGIGTIRA